MSWMWKRHADRTGHSPILAKSAIPDAEVSLRQQQLLAMMLLPSAMEG